MTTVNDVNSDKVALMIPFEGFYESYTDMMIDDACQSMNQDDDGMQLDVDKWAFDHAAIRHDVAVKYVEWLNDFLKDVCGMDILLTFVKLHSPKEYNFTTDRIECTLSYSDAHRMRDDTNGAPLRKAFADNFTSRSGFMSFYDPDSCDDVASWDHNQWGACLEAFIIQNITELDGTTFRAPHGDTLDGDGDNWLHLLTDYLLYDKYEFFDDVAGKHATEIVPTIE